MLSSFQQCGKLLFDIKMVLFAIFFVPTHFVSTLLSHTKEEKFKDNTMIE